MDNLLRIFIGVAIVGAVLTLIEKLFPAKPDKKIFRSQYLLDLQFLLFVPTIGKLMTRIAVIVTVVPIYLLVIGELPGPERFAQGFGPIITQPKLIQAIELLLFADFLSYWLHRLFHGRRLWLFHAVHHSSEELDWLSSVRVHPVNEMITAALRAVPLILFGFSPVVVAGLVPLFTLHGLLLHAHVNWTFGPLRYVLSSPVFHRWHHSRDREAMNSNFSGLFPIWDILFGTFYMPDDRKPEVFGIFEPMPTTLWGQLKQPFLKRPKQ